MDTNVESCFICGNDNSAFSFNEIGCSSSMDSEGQIPSDGKADPPRWLADAGASTWNRELFDSKRFYYDQEYDPSFYDFASVGLSIESRVQTELAGWQIEILRLWSANIGRGASKTDILFFRGILEAKEDAISANLQTFLDRKRRIGSAGRAPQICDEGPPSLMQTAFTGVDRPNEDSMVDGRMASSFGDTQSENHALSLLTFPDAFTNMTNRTTVLDQQRHGDHSHTRDALFLNDFDTSTPGLGPNSDCGKQRQLEHVVPGSLSTSHGSICHVSTGGLGVPAISSRRLRDLIDQVVSKKARRGCGSIRGHGHQQGLFKCTLGCGRRFKSSADTFRHEEIVYPQNFWFCLTCGDPNNPAEKHVFTREDKMRQHIRRLNHSINISHCRVPDIRTLYPQRCGFCPNVRYQNWKDRCKHLIQHCRKGDFAVNAHYGNVGKLQSLTNGNDDGDDDDDDNDYDDDSDKSPESEPEGSNGEGNGSASNGGGPGNIGPKRNADKDDPGQSGSTADDEDDFYGSFLRDSPSLYHFPSSVRIVEVQSAVNRQHSYTSASSTPIKWLELLEKTQTASMFKVELPRGFDDADPTSRTFAVKQYDSDHHHLYWQEGQNSRIQQDHDHVSNVTNRCCGSFEYTNAAGKKRYNVILEYNRQFLQSEDSRTSFGEVVLDFRPQLNHSVHDYIEPCHTILEAACTESSGRAVLGGKSIPCAPEACRLAIESGSRDLRSPASVIHTRTSREKRRREWHEDKIRHSREKKRHDKTTAATEYVASIATQRTGHESQTTSTRALQERKMKYSPHYTIIWIRQSWGSQLLNQATISEERFDFGAAQHREPGFSCTSAHNQNGPEKEHEVTQKRDKFRFGRHPTMARSRGPEAPGNNLSLFSKFDPIIIRSSSELSRLARDPYLTMAMRRLEPSSVRKSSAVDLDQASSILLYQSSPAGHSCYSDNDMCGEDSAVPTFDICWHYSCKSHIWWMLKPRYLLHTCRIVEPSWLPTPDKDPSTSTCSQYGTMPQKTLYCPYDSCTINFTGSYRRGNLSRHTRQKASNRHAVIYGRIIKHRHRKLGSTVYKWDCALFLGGGENDPGDAASSMR